MSTGSNTANHRNSLSRSASARAAAAVSQSANSSSEELSSNEGRPLLKRIPNDDVEDWDEEAGTQGLEAAAAAGTDKQDAARKIYGGLARHASPATTKGVFEVAFDVAAASLPAAPLLMPYAFNLTGLAIGIPLLFFLAALSWFSHVTLAVEGRYVGAASLNGLAASVFPRRFGGQAMSELLVDALTIFVSIGRSLIVLAVSSHLFSSIAQTIAPNVPLLANTSWFSAVTGLVFLIPSLVSPNRNVFVRPLLLSRLRSFSTPLYLVALCLVGARIHLGLPSTFTLEETLPSTEEGLLAIRPSKLLKGIMGSSVWAGISIIVFSVSSQQSSFAQQRSLRQTSRAHTFAEDSTLKKIRRVGWLAAAFFGLLGSSLINMAWGLVGYLAIPNGGKQVNIFLSLPQKDGLLSFARLLVLITLLATLPASLRSGRKAFRRLVVLPQRIKGPPVSLRMTAVKSKSVPRTSRAVLSSSEDEPSDDEQAPRERRKPKFKFITRLSALICWLATVTLAIVFGHGDKLVSAIEIVSCVGCTLITFLMPALFFIVLFHIRKARTIFVSDETVVNNDALLLKKEQQLQRRLSGRRAWQDIGVFIGLLPVGVVVFIRGCIALGSR